MPRYHFNSVNGRRHPDQNGAIFQDDDCARMAAIDFAADLLKDVPQGGHHAGPWQVEVTDDNGAIRFVVRTEVVESD